jgi:putative colanic acid biosysnthesis UDP-glucose lipid carrier transferase
MVAMNPYTENLLFEEREKTVIEDMVYTDMFRGDLNHISHLESISLGLESGTNNYKILQRFLDISGALVGLGILGAVFPYIYFKIKKESPGPVLFKQERMGLNNRVFVCYKIRTMDLNNHEDSNELNITKNGDRRIFVFGGKLRSLNLDELPQFYNVLKGEMTLVGPRPYPIAECSHWSEQIPYWHKRYIVKPGVTGFAQVTGHRGGTTDINMIVERLKRDFRYIKTASTITDIKIMIKTVKQMLKGNTQAH